MALEEEDVSSSCSGMFDDVHGLVYFGDMWARILSPLHGVGGTVLIHLPSWPSVWVS